MSHAIGLRHEVRGTLTCDSPVRVGGWEATATADLVIARDGTGRPYLPGTSIAGAVRAYLMATGRFTEEQLRALFGHVGHRSREGSPSWLRIDDAHLLADDGRADPRTPIPVVRDGVTIDRHAGSASSGLLYTREALPPGTRFAFRLVADTPTGDATGDPTADGTWPALVAAAVDTVVDALAGGRVPLGAGRGHGFGQVRLVDATSRSVDLADPAGLIAWLTGTVPFGQVPPPRQRPDGRLRITIHWRPVGPLLVRDSMAGTVVDTLPLTDTRVDGTVRLLLPGSSTRGALRSYAERIAKTIAGPTAPTTVEDSRPGRRPSVDEILRKPPPGVGVLFGVAPRGRGTHGGRRGALTVADCHSVHHVDTDRWLPVVTAHPDTAPTAPTRDAREARNTERDRARAAMQHKLDQIAPELPLAVSDHVAIDRWTGGASDSRLFSVLEPASTTAWEPIRLTVDVSRLTPQRATPGGAASPRTTPPHPASVQAAHPEPGDDPDAALALPLLLLVLRDLRDGWISLGYGGTRGHGQIQVTEVVFDGADLPEPWQSVADRRTLDAVLTDPPPAVAEAMAAWADRFTQEATP